MGSVREIKRRDRFGRIDFMAAANGYVMVRRPGCIPFVMREKEWSDLPEFKALREPSGEKEDGGR